MWTVKHLASAVAKRIYCGRETWGPGLTLRDLEKNWPIKQTLKSISELCVELCWVDCLVTVSRSCCHWLTFLLLLVRWSSVEHPCYFGCHGLHCVICWQGWQNVPLAQVWTWLSTMTLWRTDKNNLPCVGSRVVRIDSLHFLAGCLLA